MQNLKLQCKYNLQINEHFLIIFEYNFVNRAVDLDSLVDYHLALSAGNPGSIPGDAMRVGLSRPSKVIVFSPTLMTTQRQHLCLGKCLALVVKLFLQAM